LSKNCKEIHNLPPENWYFSIFNLKTTIFFLKDRSLDKDLNGNLAGHVNSQERTIIEEVDNLA